MRAGWLIALALLASCASAAPITLQVDLRDAPRKLIHAVETIPVEPGPLRLAYPKWLPAEHDLGPVQQHTGLFITGNGRPIRWRRDAYDVFLYHLDVPADVHSIEIRSDFIASDPPAEGGGSTSDKVAVLSWNAVVLYPYADAGAKVSDIQVQPAVTLPPQWRHASALENARQEADGSITFRTTSLERLVDSPLIAGRYFREIRLAPDVTPAHYLDMVADTPADLDIPAARIEQLSRLVRQSGKLFGYRHYDTFSFLVTLSDHISGRAVDHHQSLDNRRPAKFLTDDTMLTRYANFIPHDLVHSWNGKYRRPAGLSAPNFQSPPDGSELWIVEGLSDYLGTVLAARAGMWDLEQFRGVLADNAAAIEHRQGRTWRDLEDNGRMAMALWANQDQAYDNWRRNGFDFYREGAMVWLDVDVALRNASAGKKSLDDFVALFYGGGADTGPIARPYQMDDVIAALNQVVPLDWASFLRERVQSLQPNPTLSGIQGAGYRLVYRDQPSAWSAFNGKNGFEYSLGLNVNRRGEITDVLFDSAASQAGLVPGAVIATVQGQPYSTAVLQQAIRSAHGAIQLSLQDGTPISVIHDGGERYPALEAIPGMPDRLADIIKAR
ncbi:M61 family peptidase [Duganella sp. CY15W]|uniref:M61 family metallopeptidase n=1 Tax=Duganella sp. CY15W TaxID=2692172 RepID=UPI00136FEC77|nr:M61 family metallopeptidase [Duganella sp. CY15W]MYM31769.1 M61 family peptidase [Duganella sp. CY15W]